MSKVLWTPFSYNYYGRSELKHVTYLITQILKKNKFAVIFRHLTSAQVVKRMELYDFRRIFSFKINTQSVLKGVITSSELSISSCTLRLKSSRY